MYHHLYTRKRIHVSSPLHKKGKDEDTCIITSTRGRGYMYHHLYMRKRIHVSSPTCIITSTQGGGGRGYMYHHLHVSSPLHKVGEEEDTCIITSTQGGEEEDTCIIASTQNDQATV